MSGVTQASPHFSGATMVKLWFLNGIEGRGNHKEDGQQKPRMSTVCVIVQSGPCGFQGSCAGLGVEWNGA